MPSAAITVGISVLRADLEEQAEDVGRVDCNVECSVGFVFVPSHLPNVAGIELLVVARTILFRRSGSWQCTRELWSYHLGTRHISNSSSVRQRSVNPSSIAGEYFLYLTSKRLACGLIHCRNAWFASTKL